jgi:RNA polymerase sigma-70 factor (ECF subfamily)
MRTVRRFWRRCAPPNSDEGGGVTTPSSLRAAADGPTVTAAESQQAEAAQRLQDESDITRALRGDPGGFADLMRRYQGRAYAIALGLCGNHDDAMDAVQKAFIRIHRSLGRFRLGEPFFPWFYRIVRNAALNQRRDEGRHKGDVPLEWVTRPDHQPSPLELAEADELKTRLWEGIEQLSAELREVFLLYHFQGLRYREIAVALDVPIGTVMSRLHAARLRLRQAIEPRETE